MKAASFAVSVAPMMAWTDRHCRAFHRLLTPNALLYTEMVTANALLYGDVDRHLEFGNSEHPVVLQLGGSEPEDLARAAQLGEQFGYDAINLNCGCPSERVKRGAFGACLMREPELVAESVRQMRSAVSIPVTVKHRIGLERDESYQLVERFVDTVAKAGCGTFVVHARNAWLSGLSPKENREIPALRYDIVERLQHDFPTLEFVLNGGLDTPRKALQSVAQYGAVMLGRMAYHEPYALAEIEHSLYGTPLVDRHAVLLAMTDYLADYLQRVPGAHVRHVVRHVLGLFHGAPAARVWRRHLSDSTVLANASESILLDAYQAMRDAAEQVRGCDARDAHFLALERIA
jgi:tRNA-dihydrouridine synthase A